VRSTLKCPLVPLWTTQDLPLPTLPANSDFYPVILCTASRRVPGGEDSEKGYVQGAADDSESWAHGLTAPLFWEHKDRLLETPDDDLPDLISSLFSLSSDAGLPRCMVIKPSTQLYIGTTEAANVEIESVSMHISCGQQCPAVAGTDRKVKHVHLNCAPGKVGSRQLRHELTKMLPVIDTVVSQPTPSRILVTCPSGKDHSVGVALTILCLYADDSGRLRSRAENVRTMDKNYIKQRLGWIMVSISDANPSRATLQSVNAFLLS